MNITEVRARLLARRAELANRLERLHLDRSRATQPLSPDFSEQAVQRENDEVLDRLDDVSATELRQIDKALSRLAAGVYERCEVCGWPIEEKRLSAMPQASTCLNCAASAQVA